MATAGLDPNIERFLDSTPAKKTPAAPPASSPPPASAPPPGATTDTPATTPPTMTAPPGVPQWLHDRAIALTGGLATGLASVANAPSAWFGAQPIVPTQRDPATGDVRPGFLAPQDVQAMKDYPTTAGVGT